jgi:hypothetical protein
VRGPQERDEVTFTIASWLVVAAIGGVLGALILVLADRVF